MELTRRPHNNPHQQGWDVYYSDIHIGHIGTRDGVPNGVEQWGWRLGFYPGTPVGYDEGGTGATFEECRASFEKAWRRLKPRITDEDYERWRCERDYTAWKKRMRDKKLPMPTQTRNGRARCFCGDEITNDSIPDHIRKAHRGVGE